MKFKKIKLASLTTLVLLSCLGVKKGMMDLPGLDKEYNVVEIAISENYFIDTNKDGKIDMVISYEKGKKTPYYIAIDTDFDGVFDAEGYDYNNDGKLNRIEMYRKKKNE